MKTSSHDRTALGAIFLGTVGALALAALFFARADGPQVRTIETERVAVPVPPVVPEAPKAPQPLGEWQPPPLGPPEGSEGPTFTPFEVAPRMTNADEVQAALVREYPPLMKSANIGGEVTIWFFIDEEGKVQETVLNQSSGHFQLDEAALTVADLVRFTPAMNRDKVVPVWISLPITFVVR